LNEALTDSCRCRINDAVPALAIRGSGDHPSDIVAGTVGFVLYGAHYNKSLDQSPRKLSGRTNFVLLIVGVVPADAAALVNSMLGCSMFCSDSGDLIA